MATPSRLGSQPGLGGPSLGGPSLGLSRLPTIGTGPTLGLSNLPTARPSIGSRLPLFGPGINTTDLVLNQRELKRKYAENLHRNFGMSVEAAKASAEVAWKRRIGWQEGGGGFLQHSFFTRPSTALDVTNRVLSAPSNFVAGYVHGITHPGDLSNPWNIVRTMVSPLGKGIYEGGKAAYKGQDFTHFIDKGEYGHGFVKKHAGPVGFGMSLVFDPTMYLSFGATAGTKIAARTTLAASTRFAQKKAAEVLARKGAQKGMWWGEKFTDPVALMERITQTEGLPRDLPEAMDHLRAVGLAQKRAARRLQPFEKVDPLTGTRELVKPGPLRVAGAYLLPTAVKGGRGVRFGGKAIPGTRPLGVAMGRKFGTSLAQMEQAGNPAARAIVHGLVTDPGLRMIGEDRLKALALSEMSVYRAAEQGAKYGAEEVARDIAKGGGEKYVAPKARRGVMRMEPPVLPNARAMERMLGPDQHGIIHPPEPPLAIGVDRPNFHIEEMVDDVSSWGHQAHEIAVDSISNHVHGGTHMLEVRGADGTLNAVGDFSVAADGDRIIINHVAAGTPGGGIAWIAHLAKQYPNRVFELQPLDESVAKYYQKMGAKYVPSHDGHMEIDLETVGRLAKGQDPRPPPKIDAAKELQRIHEDVTAKVDEGIERAFKFGYTREETRRMWKEISAATSDPIEAIGLFWFKNETKIHSRGFTTHLLENPMFALRVKKGDAMPDGYLPLKDPVTNQRYAVMSEMHDAIQDLLNPAKMDKGIDAFIHFVSMPQNYWKRFATSANPSFHVMNLLGAIWNNFYAGVYNPGDYLKALATLYRGKMAEAGAAGEARHLLRSTTNPLSIFKSKEAILARREQSAQFVKEAAQRGATSRDVSVYADIETQLHPEGGKFIKAGAKDIGTRAKEELLRRPDESIKRSALRFARRGTAAGLLVTGNPVGVALLAPEAARAGRVLGTGIEDMVRLAPFMKAAKDPQILAALEAWGPIRVPGMVHSGMSKETQAAMYDIGAGISKHFQFDYSDLTVFETRFAKTLLPFYTYYKKNFLLQAQMLAQAPRGLRTADAVMNYMNENGDLSEGMQAMLPDYFNQIQAFQVPVPAGMRDMLGLPKDQPLFLNPKLPFMSLNLFPPVWQAFMQSGQPTPQKLGAVFAPIWGSVGPLAPFPLPGMKTMLEATVGQSLGLNKTLDYQRSQSNDWRNSFVPAPGWVKFLPKPLRDFMGIFPFGQIKQDKQGTFIMTATGQNILDQMSTPFVTNLGQVIPSGADDVGKARADTVSWLTGVRLIPADMLRLHRSWAYRMESMLEGQRQDLKDQGKDLDPQDKETLALVRAQIKVLEDAWDRRDQELHPIRTTPATNLPALPGTLGR